MSKVSIKNQKFRLGYPSTLVFDNMGKTINVFRIEYLRDIPRFNIKKVIRAGSLSMRATLVKTTTRLLLATRL